MSELNYGDSNQANYSSSERKLKKITQDLPFNPPPTQLIEEKINQMRMKIAMQNEVERRVATETQENGNELPKPKARMYTENPQQYNQISSLLTDRISKASLLNRTNESKDPTHQQLNRRPQMETYKKECINRDKIKHPIKYKIIREEVGINSEKVYNLKQDQVNRIQEQFIRRKGLEYLREGISAAQHNDNTRFYPDAAKARASSLKFAKSSTKIHQIFGNPISQSKRIKSQKSLKKRVRSKVILQELKEQEEMLGKIVFQKVKKHLKDEKQDPNYFRRVYSEQTINQALVDFLRVKIQRAQASLGK